MKEKLKNIQNRLRNNPKFQARIQELKPKKTIWGFLGIVFLFFVPEVINFLYYQEINIWVVESATIYYPTEVANKIIWITQNIFNGELSFVNLGLGAFFLWWFYK